MKFHIVTTDHHGTEMEGKAYDVAQVLAAVKLWCNTVKQSGLANCTIQPVKRGEKELPERPDLPVLPGSQP